MGLAAWHLIIGEDDAIVGRLVVGRLSHELGAFFKLAWIFWSTGVIVEIAPKFGLYAPSTY